MKMTALSELHVQVLAKAGFFKPPFHPGILGTVSLQSVTDTEAQKIDQALALAQVPPVLWEEFPFTTPSSPVATPTTPSEA